jgi:hypothetical protein
MWFRSQRLKDMVKRYQSVLLGGSICPGITPLRVGQLSPEYLCFSKIPITLKGGSTSAGIPGSR